MKVNAIVQARYNPMQKIAFKGNNITFKNKAQDAETSLGLTDKQANAPRNQISFRGLNTKVQADKIATEEVQKPTELDIEYTKKPLKERELELGLMNTAI